MARCDAVFLRHHRLNWTPRGLARHVEMRNPVSVLWRPHQRSTTDQKRQASLAGEIIKVMAVSPHPPDILKFHSYWPTYPGSTPRNGDWTCCASAILINSHHTPTMHGSPGSKSFLFISPLPHSVSPPSTCHTVLYTPELSWCPLRILFLSCFKALLNIS